MTAPITAASGAKYNELVALTSLEQQAMYILIELTARENIYNTNNPTAVSDRVTVGTNFDTKTIVGQIALSLSDTAVTGKLVDRCTAFLP